MAQGAIGGKVPTSDRGGIEQALSDATAEEGAPDEGAQGAESGELTEVESRIVRLEEALIQHGVLTEGDLTGPPGSDMNGQMPPEADPNAPVDPAAAGGAPPAPAPGAPPVQ